MAYSQVQVMLGGAVHIPIVIGLLKFCDNKTSKSYQAQKAAEGADFIFTCVGNDNDLSEVVLESINLWLMQMLKTLQLRECGSILLQNLPSQQK